MINPNWTEWRIENYLFLKQSLEDFCRPNEKILDVGCGPSQFYDLMEDFSLTSIDTDVYPKVDFIVDITKDMIFNRGEFDAVLMSNSLEHMESPDKIMSAVHHVLKRNGILIVMIPFLMGEHQQPRDYQRLTRYGIDLLIKKHGFRLLNFETVGDPFVLSVEFSWAAYREIHGHWFVKFLSYLHAVAASKLRRYVHRKLKTSLINSPFGGKMASGYMFVASKN